MNRKHENKAAFNNFLFENPISLSPLLLSAVSPNFQYSHFSISFFPYKTSMRSEREILFDALFTFMLTQNPYLSAS